MYFESHHAGKQWKYKLIELKHNDLCLIIQSYIALILNNVNIPNDHVLSIETSRDFVPLMFFNTLPTDKKYGVAQNAVPTKVLVIWKHAVREDTKYWDQCWLNQTKQEI